MQNTCDFKRLHVTSSADNIELNSWFAVLTDCWYQNIQVFIATQSHWRYSMADEAANATDGAPHWLSFNVATWTHSGRVSSRSGIDKWVIQAARQSTFISDNGLQTVCYHKTPCTEIILIDIVDLCPKGAICDSPKQGSLKPQQKCGRFALASSIGLCLLGSRFRDSGRLGLNDQLRDGSYREANGLVVRSIAPIVHNECRNRRYDNWQIPVGKRQRMIQKSQVSTQTEPGRPYDCNGWIVDCCSIKVS